MPAMPAMAAYQQYPLHLTMSPPEQGPSFYYNSATALQTRPSYYAAQASAAGRQDKGDYDSRFYWGPSAKPTNTASGYQQSTQRSNFYDPPTKMSSKARITSFDLLPPSAEALSSVLRESTVSMSDAPVIQPQQQPRSQDSRPKQETRKEEKQAGGVAAHLDYDMDQMAEYVSQMAQRIVHPGTSTLPPFRKFVSQILSSTRLPSATILLGLYYLSVRVGMLNQEGPHKIVPNQVYRMLTIALLLGSKFLDDNTFQNRSWSEVTGIPVVELNKLEVEWLLAIRWNLHTDPEDNMAFPAWAQHWSDWKRDQLRSTERLNLLAPIETNFGRPQSHSKNVSPGPAYPQQYAKESTTIYPQHSSYQTPIQYDQSNWLYPRSSHENSPPSAPETGPNTPEYFGLGGSWFQPAQQQYLANPVAMHRPATIVPLQQSCGYQQTHYTQQPSALWSHGVGCRCDYCAKMHSSYFMPTSYGQQTLVG